MEKRNDQACADCGHVRAIHGRVGQWATACLASKTGCVVETMCPCNTFEEEQVAQSEQNKADELREMGEAVQVIAQTVVDEVRGIVPSPSQWARAQALREAREWIEWVVGAGEADEPIDAFDAEGAIHTLTLKWARLIETGSVD